MMRGRRLTMQIGALLLTATALLAAGRPRPVTLAEIVAKTKAAYASGGGVVSFVQTGGAANLSGSLTFAGDDRFRLELPKQTIVSNGTRTWTYLPDRKQVVVSAAASGGNRLTPGQILTSFPGNYATSLVGSAKVNGRDVWVVKCTPGSGARIGDVTQATLYIDKGTYRFQRIDVVSPTLGSLQLRITKAEYRSSIPSSTFTFTPPTGTRVIDLSN